MTTRAKRLVVMLAGLLLVGAVGLQGLPYMIEHWVPGQYWSRLPSWAVASMGVNEDFLPAVANADAAVVDAAELLVFAEPTALPTATPSPTSEPTLTPTAVVMATEAVVEATAVPPTPTSPPPTATPLPTPIPLPATYRLPNMDGTMVEAQKFNNCGPTNLTLVLRNYGLEADQLEVASYLKPNDQDRNVSPWQISDYVNEETSLRSITRSNGSPELLKRLLFANFPVVIEKGYQPPESARASGWYGHYLTLFGYDDERGEYNTLDTFLGPFAERDVEPGHVWADGFPYSYEYIDEHWQQFNYTYYVVYTPAREQELFEVLGEEVLDDEQMWQATAVRAQDEIGADPENAFAWFNLGTALTRLGELTGETSYYENGATAFDRALGIGLPSRMLWYQHRPYIAYMKLGRYQDMLDLAEATLASPGGRNVEETYLYQGHALSLTGDLNGAARSFQQALELNEFFYPAQFALDYVNSIRN